MWWEPFIHYIFTEIPTKFSSQSTASTEWTASTRGSPVPEAKVVLPQEMAQEDSHLPSDDGTLTVGLLGCVLSPSP